MYKVVFPIIPYLVLAILYPLYIRRVGSSPRVRRLLFAALAFSASSFVGFWLIGGDPFVPELLAGVIWGWNILYSALMFLLPLAVMARIGRLKGRLLWWLLPVALALSVCGVYNGIRAPMVREVELEFANLPTELDGYRIVQVSDIHASAAAPRWRTEKIVRIVNELKPDLVGLTGDFSDGLAADSGKRLEPIRELKAKDGVWAVTGNHEYYADRPEWRKLYDEWGLKFLVNEMVIPRRGLALGGLNDMRCVRFRERRGNVKRVFAAATNGEFRVLLDHNPKDARENMRAGIGLQLSGHTHGGVMPLLNRVVAWRNDGFVRGVYELGEDSRLYVSSGSGQWAGFPIRLFNPSEIAVITLKKRR